MIVRAHAIAQKVAAASLFECGTSPLEQWLLEIIPDDGRACASELASELEVPTSTVTRALRRMAQYGYVTLTKGYFHDAHVLRARLTEHGTIVRNSGIGFEDAVDARLLATITHGALAGLLQGLLTIERAVQPEERVRQNGGRTSVHG